MCPVRRGPSRSATYLGQPLVPRAHRRNRPNPRQSPPSETCMADEAVVGDEEWDYLQRRRAELKVRTLSNRLYQQERQRVFEHREGLVKVASLVAGSAGIARIAYSDFVVYAGAIIFAGTAASLVFGWGSKARDAAKRASEWALLDRDIDAEGERRFTEQQLDAWTARCNEIEAGEPAQHARLFARCELQACIALNRRPIGPEPKWLRAPIVFLP